MSNKPVFMPFLVEKYLADTGHLSLEEHGAYFRLLCQMWQCGGSLPDNHSDLARMLGVQPKTWKRLWGRLAPFFQCHGGKVMQKRLQKQWNYAVEQSTKAKEKASFAARRRWEKERGLKSINNVLQAMPQASSKQCLSDAILKERYIPIPLSNTVGSEVDQINREAIEKLHRDEQRPTENLSRLLNTNLMRKTG